MIQAPKLRIEAQLHRILTCASVSSACGIEHAVIEMSMAQYHVNVISAYQFACDVLFQAA